MIDCFGTEESSFHSNSCFAVSTFTIARATCFISALDCFGVATTIVIIAIVRASNSPVSSDSYLHWFRSCLEKLLSMSLQAHPVATKDEASLKTTEAWEFTQVIAVSWCSPITVCLKPLCHQYHFCVRLRAYRQARHQSIHHHRLHQIIFCAACCQWLAFIWTFLTSACWSDHSKHHQWVTEVPLHHHRRVLLPDQIFSMNVIHYDHNRHNLRLHQS